MPTDQSSCVLGNTNHIPEHRSDLVNQIKNTKEEIKYDILLLVESGSYNSVMVSKTKKWFNVPLNRYQIRDLRNEQVSEIMDRNKYGNPLGSSVDKLMTNLKEARKVIHIYVKRNINSLFVTYHHKNMKVSEFYVSLTNDVCWNVE